VGLAVLLVLFGTGLFFNIRWMRDCGGLGLVIWGALLAIGFLGGAKE
jgi:hypothetical protein